MEKIKDVKEEIRKEFLKKPKNINTGLILRRITFMHTEQQKEIIG